MSKHRTLHLRIYKSKPGVPGVVFDAKGKAINENHKVTITHNTIEYNNWLKYVIPNGIIKIDVIGFYKDTKDNGEHTFDEVPEDIINEIQGSLKKEDVKVLTPEQKEISELKAMILEMKKGNGVVKDEKKEDAIKPTEADKKEMKGLRAELKELSGNAVGPTLTKEQLESKIAELKK